MYKWLVILLVVVSNAALSADINTYLEKYARENNVALVKKMLAKGAEVNPSYKSGSTLVGRLIVSDLNFELADFLLEKGAEVPTKGDYNEHIIAYAVDYWDEDCGKALAVSKYLVSKGAEIKKAYYKSRKNVLHQVATMEGEHCGDLAKYLIVNGADYMVNQLQTFPGTGYHAKSPFFMALNQKNYPVAKVLAEHGLDPNAPVEESPKKLTPLEMTVIKGNLALAKLLIEKGANNIAAAKEMKVRRSSEVLEYLIVEY